MKLYNYFLSGTSYRTRIVMELKGLNYEYIPVALNKGEHKSDWFTAINPMQGVPVLEVGGVRIANSPAIIEYLEEEHPHPALMPKDPLARAHVRTIAAIVGLDMHAPNNLRIRNYLRDEFHEDSDGINKWMGTWCKAGFDAIEAILVATHAREGFCFGDAPTIADAYLIPQVFTAQRFHFDMTPYSEVMKVVETCNAFDAVQAAHPTKQPDWFEA